MCEEILMKKCTFQKHLTDSLLIFRIWYIHENSSFNLHYSFDSAFFLFNTFSFHAIGPFERNSIVKLLVPNNWKITIPTLRNILVRDWGASVRKREREREGERERWRCLGALFNTNFSLSRLWFPSLCWRALNYSTSLSFTHTHTHTYIVCSCLLFDPASSQQYQKGAKSVCVCVCLAKNVIV